MLVVDPVNLRYATGTRNMQVWTMHNIVRYALVFAHGPTVLFELPTGRHLSAGLESVSDIRPSIPFDYMLVADNAESMAKRWAAQIRETLREHECGTDILAVDRADTLMIRALETQGTRVVDGKAVLEHARAIKSAEGNHGIPGFACHLRAERPFTARIRRPRNQGVRSLRPPRRQSLARGGEYPETRLLTSGARTNPWFQEASDRVIEAGDLLSFDTDLIGPMGFYNDISRSWVIRRASSDPGAGNPARHLQGTARPQHRSAAPPHVVRGVRLEGIPPARRLPPEPLRRPGPRLRAGRRVSVRPLSRDADDGMYDGRFEANMIVCVESYVGALDGPEGVKLEQPVLITDRGPEVLSELPLDAADF